MTSSQTTGQRLQSERNALARKEFVSEFEALDIEDIVRLEDLNEISSDLLFQWLEEARIFSVKFNGEKLYPKFQFDFSIGSPFPVISKILAALPRDEMSEWEVAFWWASGNGWLDGSRPIDIIHKDNSSIIEAAKHLSDPSPF